MEFINQIELAGRVGNVLFSTVQGKSLARFSLAIENAFAVDGANIVETTWFNCIVWQGDSIKDLTKLKKGVFVHTKGRVRMQRYADSSEVNRYIWEVVCQEIEIEK